MCELANDKTINTSIAINEVQLLLAQERTSLAVMRTGIAVLALPLSVMSVLIADRSAQLISRIASSKIFAKLADRKNHDWNSPNQKIGILQCHFRILPDIPDGQTDCQEHGGRNDGS